jgi:hypothetical protein
MFKGHQFVRLVNNNWVLDLTEFEGYKVKLNDKLEVESYKEAFKASVMDNEVEFEKYIKVPLKVLKEAASQILDYIKDFEDNDIE